MGRLNTRAVEKRRTHEGAPAHSINALQELRRSVMACMLWERQFYEGGVSIAERIAALVPKCKPQDVSRLAIEARTDMRLRHAPLLVAREMARSFDGRVVGDTIAAVIQRPDELTEFLAIYWKDGREPLAAQAKQGLARAFRKFDAYQLAKYDRQEKIRLRDVLFLTHARPIDRKQEQLWKQLIDGTLPAPDTWEVRLSGGADKKAAFEDMLAEDRLGYMALLRNLRNMRDAGVDENLVRERLIENAPRSKALPFRFLVAARMVPQWEQWLDRAMSLALDNQPKLAGKTILLVDVSISMQAPLSQKSEMNRMEAAAGLAILARGMCEDIRIFTFSEQVVEVPARTGMALGDAVVNSQRHSTTYLGRAVRKMNTMPYDRLIVFTDEQSHDPVGAPNGRGYMINVASYQNGVGYGAWMHIDGFSEAVLKYVHALETEGLA